MVMKLIDDTDADYIAVIFDRARKTFRSEIYADYKANRPPPPDELIPQFQLVRNATEAMNVPAIDMDGFEADDLIATYARQAAEAGAEVTIVSSDKDLMQLVTRLPTKRPTPTPPPPENKNHHKTENLYKSIRKLSENHQKTIRTPSENN